MTDFSALPKNLPPPVDDGQGDHLAGQKLPPVGLPVAGGGTRLLTDFPTRWLVLYVYPRTGGPGINLPKDWDMIPGARGCTPQGCAFRDHHAELETLDATVVGISAQPIREQAEFAQRMHIPFALLNDSELTLSNSPVALPTFDAGGMTLYRRLTLIVEGTTIRNTFYPVFPPDQNAGDVIDWLTDAP